MHRETELSNPTLVSVKAWNPGRRDDPLNAVSIPRVPPSMLDGFMYSVSCGHFSKPLRRQLREIEGMPGLVNYSGELNQISARDGT